VHLDCTWIYNKHIPQLQIHVFKCAILRNFWLPFYRRFIFTLNTNNWTNKGKILHYWAVKWHANIVRECIIKKNSYQNMQHSEVWMLLHLWLSTLFNHSYIVSFQNFSYSFNDYIMIKLKVQLLFWPKLMWRWKLRHIQNIPKTSPQTHTITVHLSSKILWFLYYCVIASIIYTHITITILDIIHALSYLKHKVLKTGFCLSSGRTYSVVSNRQS
jgi:hypothetical protein